MMLCAWCTANKCICAERERMTSLVERLRDPDLSFSESIDIVKEAADYIERLETALREIANKVDFLQAGDLRWLARAALGPAMLEEGDG